MSKKIMACVTLQTTCKRLIEYAHNVAIQEKDAELFVLHVSKNGHPLMGGTDDAGSIQYLFDVTSSFGAEMTVITSDNVFQAICDFIKENNITTVVMGCAKSPKEDSGIVRRLSLECPELEIIIE